MASKIKSNKIDKIDNKNIRRVRKLKDLSVIIKTNSKAKENTLGNVH